MNELLTTLGFVWRTIDGRGNDNPNPTPPYWNVYIYLGLLTILCGYVYLEYMTALQALGIYAVVLTYILSGYRSLTGYWVYYHIKRGFLFAEYRFDEIVNGWDDCNFVKLRFKVDNLDKWYNANDKGFSSWYMSYRYVIAGALICAILGTWSVPYLIACSVAGLLFPISVRLLEYIPEGKRDFWGEVFAKFREGVLGAVIIGGWTWLI